MQEEQMTVTRELNWCFEMKAEKRNFDANVMDSWSFETCFVESWFVIKLLITCRKLYEFERCKKIFLRMNS